MAETEQALHDWRAFAQAAVSGELRIDPTVAEDCRRACEQFIDNGLYVMRQGARRVEHLTGFGGFASGAAMQAKFESKANGSQDSFTARLDQHVEVVKLMQLTFAMSCAQLTEKDIALRDQLAKLRPGD